MLDVLRQVLANLLDQARVGMDLAVRGGPRRSWVDRLRSAGILVG
jgi:hypothetical protein